MRLRDWPDNVYPSDEYEQSQAINLLLRRLGAGNEKLTPAQQRAIADELGKWFSHGYSVKAILTALDRHPDNQPQQPRARNEELPHYLHTRMQAWNNEEDDAPLRDAVHPPPRPGINLHQWHAINERVRQTSGIRPPQQLSDQGDRARRAAIERSRAPRTDAVARSREKDHAIRDALDSLLPPGHTPHTIEDTHTPLPHHARTDSRMVATYAGSRSVITRDPRVRRLIQRLTTERRPATRPELAVLRNAIRDARTRAALGTLDALHSETSDNAGILSPEAWRILNYLEHAMANDTPVDSLTTMLDQAVTAHTTTTTTDHSAPDAPSGPAPR